MKKLLGYLVLTVLMLSSIEAYAASLKCGNEWIDIGDYKADVLLKCGEPFLKDTVCVDDDGVVINRDSKVIETCKEIDQWTYNPGPGKFLRILDFEGGKLESIHEGDRIKE